MRVLLDTHILLWWVRDDPRLSNEVRAMLSNPEVEVFVSSISLWEVVIKRASGKLDVSLDGLMAESRKNGFLFLPFDERHALRVSELPELHGDPFDRALIAQSQSEPLILLTHDRQLAQYGAPVRLV